MKENLLALIILSSTINAQVGINTDSPQKTLHINGSVQLTNELNVGGNESVQGSPGVNGQFLVSQGPDNAPLWTTVNIPTLDENSYKLKGVYNFDLLDPFTNTNSTYLALGNFNSIKVDNPLNFVVIEFQSTASVISFASGESMSYRYRLIGNNSFTSQESPFYYSSFNGFNPNNNVISYKFFVKDIIPNTYNFTLQAVRSNTSGTNTASKFLHFNRTYSTSTSFIRDGKAIVYVYEK